jgi:hypothetical protein
VAEHGDLTPRVSEIVARALREIRAEVDLDDDEARAVVAGLIRVVGQGVRLGAAEVSAHAIEHGIDLELNLDIADDVTSDDIGRGPPSPFAD